MRIAVLGAGNMGRWLVRELAADHEVCVYDPVASERKAWGRSRSSGRWTGSPLSGPTSSSTRSA